ncbi:MAG: DUF58 domain-containing protein [Candidatus Dormibacteria bacterium]
MAAQRLRGLWAGPRRRRVTERTSDAGWEIALRRAGLTTGGAALIALAAAGWIIARVEGSRSLFLMVYGSVIVLGLAWYLGRARRALEARRSELPVRVRQGQMFEVEITVEAKRRVGGVLLEEQMHPHMGRSRRIHLDSISPARTFQHRYAVTPALRGVYRVGPLIAIWSDPFGFTRREHTLAEAAEVIVHPATEHAQDRPLTRQWEDPPVRPPVSKPWPSGFDFYGMRRYVPGDDPRRIVWRAVARTGKVMVREFEQGITDRCAILVDNHDAHHSSGLPSDTFEAAIMTAATLGTRYLKDGFGLTLDSNDTRLERNLRGPRAATPFLDALARMELSQAPFADGIERLVAEPRTDVHHLIVTSHLDDTSATRLKLLVDRGAYVVLVVLVWEETDPHSLVAAASLGCSVVQLRPRQPLAAVFAHSLGAGRR